MTIHDFPWINASLNATSAAMLAIGWVCIKAGWRKAHASAMIGALGSSTIFLGCYLYYHAHVGATRFVDPAWFRPWYLALLISHTLLAVVIVPLIILTVLAAARERFERHRAIARWTLPLWFYVSVTGVAIYELLYQVFPQG
jgi:uncharacterized membrane protein YozB (DUF420 family)